MQEKRNDKSLSELRAEAKARGIHGFSNLRKQELISLLNGSGEIPSQSQNTDEPEVQAAEAENGNRGQNQSNNSRSSEEAAGEESSRSSGERAGEESGRSSGEKAGEEGSRSSGERAGEEGSRRPGADRTEERGRTRDNRPRRNPGNNSAETSGRTVRYGNYRNPEQGSSGRRTQGESRRINGENRSASAWMMPEPQDSRRRPENAFSGRRTEEGSGRGRDNHGEEPGSAGESGGRSRENYGENNGSRNREGYGENGSRNRENYGENGSRSRENYGENGSRNREGYGDNSGRNRGAWGENNRRNYGGSRTAAETQENGGESRRVHMDGWNTGTSGDGLSAEDILSLDSGMRAHGILEIVDNYGFIRGENYMPGDDDIYVSPNQIRRFHMRTGDVISGSVRVKTGSEKYAALLYVTDINGEAPAAAEHRRNFDDLTPVFPDERIRLEHPGCSLTMRIVDLMSPIGKGQRGMIVSPPKAGKTTLMKDIARSIQVNNPEMHIVILLIDERPEEVTDIRECIQGDNVEVIYSTFDELPEHHRRVSEMVLGRAKCLVEHGKDVVILLDSITRLARAYNLSVAPSGRTLSGGLDPAALYMPKKFFGAARNMREGGSLTILATALVDTGSRMDDVVFEEFKGTGNMEVVLDRKLSERRIFPAIDIQKSGTRREDLLLKTEEKEAIDIIRRGISGMRSEDAVEQILNLFARTKTNTEFIEMAKKIRL